MRFACPTLAVLLALTSCTNDGAGDDGQGDGESGPSDTNTEAGTTQSDSDPTTNGDNTDNGEGGTNSGTDGGSEGTDEGTDTGEPCEPFETTEVADCAEVVGEGFCSEGGGHVPEGSEIEWMNNPPHSGPHYPIWETPGEHNQPVDRGYWVHNLEHGWIVFVHNCANNCMQELDVLREVMELRPDASILMTADPLLDGPRFAALSWTWVHEFDTPSLEELLCFVDQHHDHAPESVH